MMVSGLAMGLSPREVRGMTIQDFVTLIDGWSAAHGGKKKAQPMSDKELEALGIE